MVRLLAALCIGIALALPAEVSAQSKSGHPAAGIDLAREMLETGRLADADRVARGVTQPPDLRLQALALRGEILAAQGKVAEGLRLLDPERDAPGLGGRRVRLELAELLVRSGRRADAEPLLQKFADDYASDAIPNTDAEGLAMVGRAMDLWRSPKDANRAYNESERAERGRVETLLWRAALFVDKYDPGHAEEVLGEALEIAPHRADAMVMLARLKLEEALDFSGAEKLATDALAVNPKDTGAYAVFANIALRDGNLEKAAHSIDAGLAVDSSDLELLSLRAAARFLSGDAAAFEAAKAEVFARNKEFSQFYGIVGEFAEWEHRYADVIAMMQEAVALDPDDAKAWAQLGLTQTRGGDETGGVASLENAWHRDHFNVRVYNTLQLLYKTWIPQQYDTVSSGVFNIRYPKNERPVLERYVPRLLDEAWGVMKRHYMFSPVTPTAVEMYGNKLQAPDHVREAFSVRTSGLPNVGIQGVCFGRVVAAMSPGSEPFNWGNVLWHELGHVFAIQLSNSRVPRWFTEGLSEYETMIRRPEWRRNLDPELYRALKKNKLPGTLAMNTAFTHAEGELDVTVAYYAASQMLAFVGDRFGFPAITHALQLWGQGQTTPEVFRGAFGLTPGEFDGAFRGWALARLARYDGQYMFDPRPEPIDEARARAQAMPPDADAHVAYAMALFRSRRADEASHEIEAALQIDAHNKNAHFVAFKIALERGAFTVAEEHLHDIEQAAGAGYTVALALADVARGRHDKAAERAALERAHAFDPTQPEPLRALVELDNDEGRDVDALSALGEIVKLDQHDRRAWALLLEKLTQAKRWDEAKRVGEGALYVDIESAPVHVAYARALSATGDHQTAAFELESALLCDSKPEEKATARTLLAAERLVVARGSQAKAK
jgi:cellulose synthase operon protein C